MHLRHLHIVRPIPKQSNRHAEPGRWIFQQVHLTGRALVYRAAAVNSAACVVCPQTLRTRTTEICASSSASSLPWQRRCSSSCVWSIGGGGAPACSSANRPSDVDCRPPMRSPPMRRSSTAAQTASATAAAPSKCATSAAPTPALRRIPPTPPRLMPLPPPGTLCPGPRRRRCRAPTASVAAPVNDCSRKRRRRFLSYDSEWSFNAAPHTMCRPFRRRSDK